MKRIFDNRLFVDFSRVFHRGPRSPPWLHITGPQFSRFFHENFITKVLWNFTLSITRQKCNWIWRQFSMSIEVPESSEAQTYELLMSSFLTVLSVRNRRLLQVQIHTYRGISKQVCEWVIGEDFLGVSWISRRVVLSMPTSGIEILDKTDCCSRLFCVDTGFPKM